MVHHNLVVEFEMKECPSVQKTRGTPVDTRHFIHSKVEEVWRAINGHESEASNCPRREIFIRWIALPSGWITLNTDGVAMSSPGLASG